MKTPEEAAEEHAERTRCTRNAGRNPRADAVRDFLAGVRWRDSNWPWIKCSDRQPDRRGVFLVAEGDGHIDMLLWDGEWRRSGVLLWMEVVPPAPEGKES